MTEDHGVGGSTPPIPIFCFGGEPGLTEDLREHQLQMF